MKRALAAAIVFASASAFADIPVARVAADAKVVDRVAEASRKDLPQDVLRRIVNEDIELLRGKRADGTYEYAGYDRMESGRKSDTYSVDPQRNESVIELTDAFAYRVLISVPSRRMLVTKNRHVYVDRIEVEYLPQKSPEKKFQTIKVGAWIEPGESRTFDLEDIARQATARIYAKADKDGYANVTVSLIEARIYDEPASPYADAVASEKAILRAIDHSDIASMRAMAQRIVSELGGAPAASNAPVTIAATPATSHVDVTASRNDPETAAELQAIEDLLTGTEAERRQGLDRLHQLLRRMRTQSH